MCPRLSACGVPVCLQGFLLGGQRAAPVRDDDHRPWNDPEPPLPGGQVRLSLPPHTTSHLCPLLSSLQVFGVCFQSLQRVSDSHSAPPLCELTPPPSLPPRQLTFSPWCTLRYGFVPNGGRVYYERRSQPPFLTLMVESYYQATQDQAFLR